VTLTELTTALKCCTCLKSSEIRQVLRAIKCIVNTEIEETGTSESLFVLIGRGKERKKFHGVILDEF